MDCPVCGEPLSAPTVKCSGCGVLLHKKCAKRTLGKSYCKSCYKQAKKTARYEIMARKSAMFG